MRPILMKVVLSRGFAKSRDNPQGGCSTAFVQPTLTLIEGVFSLRQVA
jgi:hypothetical protein